MLIVLPWPDKSLNPNARKHWRALAAAKKKAREIGHCAALEAVGSELPAVRSTLSGEEKIELTVRFYPPDKRHRDADNQVASVKAHLDGIADALKVNDRRFRPHFFFEDAAKPGRVEVVIPNSVRPPSAASALPRVAEVGQKENGPSACGNTEPGPDHDRSGVAI